MAIDEFFTKKKCDRCGKSMRSRIMSWFTDEVICLECSLKERELRDKLPNGGSGYEGCGYMPKV